MKNVLNANLDAAIGGCVATLIGNLLRANDIEVPAQFEIVVSLLVLAVLARLGVKLKTAKKKADDA